MTLDETTQCVQWFSETSCKVMEFIGNGLNSNFSTALLGSLAGALAGAVAAHRIVERSKRREELIKEIRNTNAAAMVGFSICNAALRLKTQHVEPLYKQFLNDKASLENFYQQRASGQISKDSPFHFVADLKTFAAPILPTETLKELVFDRISVHGRPLSLVSQLVDSSQGLRTAIEKRDVLVERFKDGSVSQAELPMYYFGLTLGGGHINQEYPDLISAIHSHVNDIAFFSALLCDDLVAHGNLLVEAFGKRIGKGAPKISQVDFSRPREKGLIPPEAEYIEWINAFVKQDENKK